MPRHCDSLLGLRDAKQNAGRAGAIPRFPTGYLPRRTVRVPVAIALFVVAWALG